MVFGGGGGVCAIERKNGCCLMTEVPDRRRETLEPIIRRWILPGSRIISDGCRCYDLLNQLDFRVYDHDIVIHQYTHATSLTRPMRPFTRRTLGTHGSARNVSLKRRYGTSQVLFTSYFSEFLWHNKYGNLNVFGELINTIREFYML